MTRYTKGSWFGHLSRKSSCNNDILNNLILESRSRSYAFKQRLLQVKVNWGGDLLLSTAFAILRGFDVVSYPRREVSPDFGWFHGRVLLLVVQQLDSRPQTLFLRLSSMFPSRVYHHAAHQQAGADSIVPGQIDGEQGAQTFPEGPQHSHGADPFGFGGFCSSHVT